MAEQSHESLIDRIKAWRAANEAAETKPADRSLKESRKQLLAELTSEIVCTDKALGSDERVSLPTALSRVDLKLPVAQILAELQDAAGVGPFPAVDGDNWAPENGWPERQWLIPGWLPLGRLGLFTGRGARGKSRLALQLAARMAADPPLPGTFVPPVDVLTVLEVAGLRELDTEHCGPVVYVSCEDERAELGRRLEELERDDLAKRDRIRGRLRYVDLRGKGPLWAPEDSSSMQAAATLTPVGRRIRATVESMNARLLVIDSLAGAYGSDENVRALVRAFCSDWDCWASKVSCTVMLVAHPPKTQSGVGAATVDRDYAGSTDWHNAARWRWTLEPVPTGSSRYTTTSRGTRNKVPVKALALTCSKASYGPVPGHVFVAPSNSGVGWRGVTEESAVRAAADAGEFSVADDAEQAEDEIQR